MDVVTGAFGYIGKYIARTLLSSGNKVKTITTHTQKENPFENQVKAYPYHFDAPDLLIQNLKGCDTLFNTYWVRFTYGKCSFEKALENTKILFECAKKAEIKKIVHISVTNVSETDELPYYRGKALQEKALKESGVPYSIIRPTLVYGKEDILVNNMAWMLRVFPVFPIFGSGEYIVQPVFVEDLASIAVNIAKDSNSSIIDAIGAESFTFKDLIKLMATKMGINVRFIHVNPALGILAGKIIGLFVKDVVLTKDELQGLMLNKLCSNQIPNGKTLFSKWLNENRESIGNKYTSELNRHFHWKPPA